MLQDHCLNELKAERRLGVAAALLAAGEATRLGGMCKASLLFNNKTLLEHAVLNLQSVGVVQLLCCIRDTQVEVMNRTPRLKNFIESRRLPVFVPRRGFGLSETVKGAYAYFYGTQRSASAPASSYPISGEAASGPEGVLFHQVDRPFIGQNYFKKLIELFKERRCAVISSFAGEWMPPVIVPHGLTEQVALLKNDEGLKKLFLKSNFEFVALDASQEDGFAFDIDTPTDLLKLHTLAKPWV